MKQLAEADGLQFDNINRQQVDGVDLEHAFNEVSKIAVSRELFDNDASLFIENFTLPQRRLLYYQLSRIIRAWRCRHRRYTAQYSLPADWHDL